MRLRTLWFGFAALLSAVLTLAYLRPSARQALAPPPIPFRTVATVVERAPRPVPVADSVVALALRLLGTDYCYAGTTPGSGFDCSGFVTYVFSRFGLDVPHSSNLQATTGRFVPRHLAQPGDIIIFTGTDPARREPGHAGIVISQPGEVLRFVHASSARRNPGVQIDQVDSTRYDTRFLQIRRVIGELPGQAARSKAN
jgi:cell wall-associated NlpC family hydrolase